MAPRLRSLARWGPCARGLLVRVVGSASMVAAPGGAVVVGGQADRGFQVRHPVDAHLPVVVVKQHRVAQRGRPGPQVHAGRVDERAAETQAPRGVVVAADHDHPGTGLAQPDQGLLAQCHRVNRRHRAVVDVTSDEHGVHLFRARRLDQVIQERGLRAAQVRPVQRAPEVPV